MSNPVHRNIVVCGVACATFGSDLVHPRLCVCVVGGSGGDPQAQSQSQSQSHARSDNEYAELDESKASL